MAEGGRSMFSDRRFQYSLSSEWIKKAREELDENPTTVREDVQRFREKVRGVKNLRSRLDDCFLLSFLRARKFNHEKALKVLKKYYDFRRSYAEYFEPLIPSENMHLYESNRLFKFLKEKDSEGRTIVIIKIGNIDPNILPAEIIWRGVFMVADIELLDQTFQIGGVVPVLDFSGMGFVHLKYVTLKFIKVFCFVLMDTYPIRFKKLHLLNTPFYFDAIFRLFKPFLPKKILDRVCVHGSKMTNFDDSISPEILPEEYGGKRSGFDNSWWYEEVKEIENALREMPLYGFRPNADSHHGRSRNTKRDLSDATNSRFETDLLASLPSSSSKD